MNFRQIKVLYVEEQLKWLEKNYELGVITPDEFYEKRSDLAGKCGTFETQLGRITEEEDNKKFADFLGVLNATGMDSGTAVEICKKHPRVIFDCVCQGYHHGTIVTNLLHASGNILRGTE